MASSDEQYGAPTYYLYKDGEVTPLDFGPSDINNNGIVSGTSGCIISGTSGSCGVRFNPGTSETTLLYPTSLDQQAQGRGINNRGDVLGYSFNWFQLQPPQPYHERIGVWDRKGTFKTYFDEIDQTIVSDELYFNDNNLIVFSDVKAPASEKGNSYLVPRPGVRLNLASLVENLPLGESISNITDINSHGDMTGHNQYLGTFLLQRIGATAPQSFSTPDETSPAAGRRHETPPAIAAMLLRYQPPSKSGSALR